MKETVAKDVTAFIGDNGKEDEDDIDANHSHSAPLSQKINNFWTDE